MQRQRASSGYNTNCGLPRESEDTKKEEVKKNKEPRFNYHGTCDDTDKKYLFKADSTTELRKKIEAMHTTDGITTKKTETAKEESDCSSSNTGKEKDKSKKNKDAPVKRITEEVPLSDPHLDVSFYFPFKV